MIYVQLALHIFGKQLQFWVQKPFHYLLMICLSSLELPGSKKLVHFIDHSQNVYDLNIMFYLLERSKTSLAFHIAMNYMTKDI